MLNRHMTIALVSARSRQSLAALGVAALVGAMALHDRLPVRLVALEIPSTLGTPPGAAPQESVAPRLLDLLPAMQPPLPREATPAEAAADARSPDDVASTGARSSTSAAWSDRLPSASANGDGSGSIAVHSRQPTMISTLAGTVLKSLQRIRSATLLAAKPVVAARRRPATPHPVQNRANASFTVTAPRLAASEARLGGPAAAHAILGGPASAAAHHAPVVNGNAHSYR